MSTISEKLKFLKELLGAPGYMSPGFKNVDYPCPVCNHETKKKLCVLVETGAFHCWVCNYKSPSIHKALFYLSRIDLLEEANYLYGIYKINKPKIETLEDNYEPIRNFKTVISAKNSKNYHERKFYDYCISRNLSDETISAYRMFYSDEQKHWGRVFIPSFNDAGFMNYHVGRLIKKPEFGQSKYINPVVQKQKIVFNECDVDFKKELVLVEGPFDLTACYGKNATCLLGSSIDQEYVLFQKIVENNTPIVLALDPDATKKCISIAGLFSLYNIDVSIVDLPEETDPSSLGNVKFLNLLKEKNKFNISYKINKIKYRMKLT